MADFLVVQSDFGQADGAVSAMYGVAYQVSEKLTISDLTHDIEPYNIHDASYRLMQTTPYWPKGTVFVSIVDPGVGSNRRSVCVLLETGQYVITPDNGTLTFLKEYVGIKEARQINEATERLPSSGESHTFHGRDIYIYNGARLASQKVSFETLGSELAVDELTTFDLIKPTYSDKKVTGTVDTLDVRFGSLWTNIPLAFFKKWQANYGDSFDVKISYHGTLRYHATVANGRSFAQVGQARGTDLSKDAPLMKRIKGNLTLAIPLIFSSLDRIDTISSAMELRRFGKLDKRTWYMTTPLKKADIIAISIVSLIVLVGLWLILLNQGRFYNPFV